MEMNGRKVIGIRKLRREELDYSRTIADKSHA